MEIPRGYGLARAIFEKKENPSAFLPKTFSILSKGSQNPIEAQIIEELFFATESGAVCLDLDFFIKKNELNNQTITKEIIESLEKKNIIFVNNKFYFKNTYEIEQRIIKKLTELFQTPSNSNNEVHLPDNFRYSKEQISSVRNALQNKVSIITGGPGTGKTTLIRLIVYNLLNMSYSPQKIRLVSPTGKAAKRLSDSLGVEAQKWNLETPTTLHKLLGYNPDSGKFFFNSENPLALDVLLIDESSMIDIYILDALLLALLNTSKTKLIFIGDPNQLLSVNKGAIFSDLIALGKNVSKITKVYRQKQEAEDLRKLIESIQNENPSFLEQFQNKQNSSVNWINVDQSEINSYLKTWYANYKDKNSQILTPFNQGKLGVEGINQYFIKEFPENPPRILTSNLSSIQLFNGETGFLFEENGNYFFSKTLEKQNLVLIPNHLLKHFSYAFAITIHKSQGSEYDHVCLVLPPLEEQATRKEEMLTKRLVYTAVTRAKKSVTIVGSLETWRQAIQNSGYPRMSGFLK